jgi:Tol biopolymer transport system component
MVEDLRVIRRLARLVALCLGLASPLALAPAAWAAGGAELGLIHLSPRLGPSAETFDPGGRRLATILPAPGQDGPRPFFISPLSWSGDGQFLLVSAFAELPGKPESESSTSLYAAPAEGGAPVAIPGTKNALFPVGLPDGETVAFVRVRGRDSEAVSVEVGTGKKVVHRTESRYSLWLTGIDNQEARRITPWRTNGYDIPTSVSPDGSTLALSRVTIDRSNRRKPASRTEAILLSLATGSEEKLGPNITSASFSPDGSRLAVTVERRFPRPHVTKTKKGTIEVAGDTDVFVEDRATSMLTQITSGPGEDADPVWDPSGQRLAFLRYGDLSKRGAEFGIGDSIYEVNADGSCLTNVLHEADGGFAGLAWRPGPDRGAGPIAC